MWDIVTGDAGPSAQAGSEGTDHDETLRSMYRSACQGRWQMPTAETYTVGGGDLPLWRFDTWPEAEAWLDLTPEHWLFEVREDLFPTISGFFCRNYDRNDRVAAFFVAQSWYGYCRDHPDV